MEMTKEELAETVATTVDTLLEKRESARVAAEKERLEKEAADKTEEDRINAEVEAGSRNVWRRPRPTRPLPRLTPKLRSRRLLDSRRKLPTPLLPPARPNWSFCVSRILC